ncbi:MAG: M56 family metallopeptidase [Vicinamibacterales bacterium]
MLASLYILGAVGLAIGAGRGWYRARCLCARARLVPDWEIALAPAGLVAESAEVRVPLTIGTLAPRIILPAGWRQWPTGTLAAVIAHERAHADRRDLLVSFAARLNVCLFWFHPLSWWLERRIASTAEQAADDGALRAGGHGADYARVLLDMADAVRQAGGRVAWPGLGMGAARLDHRIDRVLDRASRRSTRFQRGLVAGACGLAVAIGSACSLADDTLPDSLTPRDIVVTPGSRSASLRIRSEAMNMSEAGARALQEQWRRQPADLVAAETLLAYYQPLHNSFFVAGAPDWIERRREVALWVIEHRPASPLATQANLAFSNRGFARLADPEGVARAAALWRARIDDADADARALKNAAMFFVQIQDDPRAAERALLRGRTLDPRLDGRTVGGVRYDAWTANIPGLGSLYADVLTRRPDASESERRSRGDADEAFAREIRAKLEATTDAALLAETGRALIRYQRWPPPLPVDPVALGRSYLQRAIALDPAIARAHRAQRSLDESGNTGG